MTLRQRIIDIPLGFAKEHLENPLIKRAACRMIQNIMDREAARDRSQGRHVLDTQGLLDHQVPIIYVTVWYLEGSI